MNREGRWTRICTEQHIFVFVIIFVVILCSFCFVLNKTFLSSTLFMPLYLFCGIYVHGKCPVYTMWFMWVSLEFFFCHSFPCLHGFDRRFSYHISPLFNHFFISFILLSSSVRPSSLLFRSSSSSHSFLPPFSSITRVLNLTSHITSCHYDYLLLF